MVNRRYLLVTAPLLLALSLTMAGCETGTASPSPSPAHPFDINPKPNSELAGNKANESKLPETVTVQEAWKDAKIKVFDAVLPDGRLWSPMTLTDDGTIAAIVPTQKPVTKPLDLILYDTATDQYEVIATLSGTSQVSGVSLNDKWVVWSESLDNSYLNWKMHVFNRSTKQDHVVAESLKDENGNGFEGPLWMPMLSGDEFVWSPSVGHPTPEKGVQVVVKKYNIQTGKTEELAQSAGNPSLQKDLALWIGRDDKTNDGALFSYKGGVKQQLTSGKSIAFFASDGESVAWSGLQRGSKEHWEMGIRTPQGEQRLLKSTRAEDPLQFLTMGYRALAWTSYDKVQVYDRQLDKVITLETKDPEYSSVYATNNFLYWTTPISQTDEERRKAKENGIYPAKIHLVDLKSLK